MSLKPDAMDRIRNLCCGVLGFKYALSKEIGVLIPFVAIAFLIAPWMRSYDIDSQINSLEIKTPSKSGQIELGSLPNLQEMIKKSRNYRYLDTQIGFYLKDLKFFSTYSKFDAEKRILNALPKRLAKKAKKYVRAVLKVSQHHQVDPIWIFSVMWTESNFDYSAKSWAGARGLMQIMPSTRNFIYKSYHAKGKKLLIEKENFNINEYFPYRVQKEDLQKHLKKLANIELGVIYLKELLSVFNSHKYATVAYNMGPGWTRGRLKRNQPVGVKNQYLDKVKKAYKTIIEEI